ncbi:DUF4365 domain-containing protein [Paraburkholderia bannensis]|uniref:DUF4365 domain-containing protein n=1 Tax=Paraburkholderia bannensis TaxID=765414 RepID=UPI002ABD3204|nr:DUF4365 domain-containing protein [Paraburkholderia bannensis]
MTTLLPKEIGRLAGRIFAYHLPPNWAVRSQEDQEDYGIDAEIEVISPEDKGTGFIFKAQIKGQKSVNLIDQGELVSFDLPIERLAYYMRQIEIPLILVVVDVSTKRAYWTSLQDSEEIAETLRAASNKGQKTATVHLRASNTLPESSDDLLAAVERNMNWLRLHALDRLAGPIDELLAQSTDELLEKMLRDGKRLNFDLYNEKFDRLLKSGQHQALLDATSKVLNSATELVDTRLTAGLYIERVMRDNIDLVNPTEAEPLVGLYTSLLVIVRQERAEARWRLLVISMLRALRLNHFVNTDYHYFSISKHVAPKSLTGWILNTSRLKVSRQAGGEIAKVIQLVHRVIAQGNYGLFLSIVPRFAPHFAIFAHRLSVDGLSDQAHTVSTWLKCCVELAIAVAETTGEADAFIDVITINALSKLDEDGNISAARVAESLELAERIQDVTKREAVQEHLADLRNSAFSEAKELTPDEEIEAFRSRALALGFNVNDPKDKFGQIIQQGLLDYNPERVIKHCAYLVMVPSRFLGVPAQMVGLPSATMKLLHCLKKGHTMGGWRLDDIYTSPLPGQGFKQQYCDGCEMCIPRELNWKWSGKWQSELAEHHKVLFARLMSF